MAANYAADGSGFLNQLSNQLKTEGQTPHEQQNQTQGQEQQQEWTQEQIQQYYQQYYNYYGQYPPADGTQQQTAQQPQQPTQTTTEGQAGAGGVDYSAYAAYNDPSALAAAYAYTQSFYGRPTAQNLPPGEPTRSIWLGNVHPESTEADLHALFGGFGLIESVKLLPAKSCAFVKFYELDAAIQAHTSMIGGSIHGQQFRIGWGKSEPTREDGGPPPCRNLWLGNLSGDVSEELVRSVFGQFGPIEKVRMLPAKNCAFVNFATLDAAIAARQQMQGAMLDDQPVKINFGKENPRDEGEAPKPLVDELPPPERPPPASYGDQQVIDKLADFVARNGLKFEVLTLEKQKDNPKFAFLKPEHQHHGYYRYRIWCLRHPGIDPRSVTPDMLIQPEGAEPSYPPPNSYQQPPPHSYQQAPPVYGSVPPPSSLQPERESRPPEESMSEDVRKLSNLLDNLVATKESIKTTKNWVTQHPQSAKDFARYFRSRMQRASSFETKLNLVHLVHDILHHCARERGKEPRSDMFIDAFQPYLGSILRHAVDRESPESCEKVFKVLRIWEDKKIYSLNDIRSWEDEMKSTERVHLTRSSYSQNRSRDRDRGRDPRDRGDRDYDRKRRDRDPRDRDPRDYHESTKRRY